jgi:transposase
VLGASVWRHMLGVDRATVIEVIDFDEEAETVVVHVRPRRSTKRRCGRCGTRAPGYDQGEGRRNWRAVDLGTLRCFLQADAPRVNCYTHGPTVAQVPWARHNAGHTRDFDDTVAWLAVQTSKTAVTELMRIAWRSVGAIITRVSADIDARVDRLDGLRRIGIDEISYKRGHRFITVVVDHDTRRLVWAAAGRDMATLNRFFEALGAERCSLITHVSADSADWIARCVATHCPEAALCADPFHIVAWATEAIDEVRRTIWNEARGGRSPFQLDRRRRARPKTSTELRRVRWALWKNPENVTEHQQHQLDWIAENHPKLWRAYRLKEGLRYVFAVKGDEGKEALDAWLRWASRSQLPPFVYLAKRIRRARRSIDATLEHRLSNGLIESMNTKIRVMTRVAYGFGSAHALIALAILAFGGHKPALPGRE